MKSQQTGNLVISLDFELMWGVFDKKSISNYGSNILGVHTLVPKLLKVFEQHGVKATFATVGFLFAKNKTDLFNYLPSIKPLYTNKALTPYGQYLETVNEFDEYHYALPLIQLIQSYGHEIASHTFCHYYCKEHGQTKAEFEADLNAAIAIAKQYGIELKSMVFPRNQVNEDYLEILTKLGISSYRGNEKSWLYASRNGDEETIWRRFSRIIDAYINVSGHNAFAIDTSKTPINIPSSRFLRPFNPALGLFENLRINRIKSSMLHAARNQLNYHLWWHPHNFGIYQEQNLHVLSSILSHYKQLQADYGFGNQTMAQLSKTHNQ
ncbi:MAG: polysaccharide deacetylase family protein [Bacteroidia bacterium]|jgi:peptidoglycan/xylan/chitin deacetylase (PgdA/CDA1 family)|nr:polysaccharide deacetylase family protein [Bacteroidia bacterium]